MKKGHFCLVHILAKDGVDLSLALEGQRLFAEPLLYSPVGL